MEKYEFKILYDIDHDIHNMLYSGAHIPPYVY